MSIHFSDSDFEEKVLKSSQPVLVDFFAEWCGPCKMMSPTIDKLATEYESKVTIGKLDVDANGQTAGKYMVQSIPTLLFFKGGEVVDKLIGYKSEEELKKHLDALL
jgi:thioredoxin 1